MRNKVSILIVLLLCAVLFSGCALLNWEPPTAADTKVFLEQHQVDIDVVVEYMKGLNCDSAYIDNDDGTVFYEFEDHEISSEKVKSSIHHLWRAGCNNIWKHNDQGENTIGLELWYRTIGDVDCGIACTIDGQGTPITEFQTECVKITDEWFYFYDDYEAYRSHS